MGGWMDGWTDGWMDGCMDGWMDGWMDGCMDGWMDRWMDGCMGLTAWLWVELWLPPRLRDVLWDVSCGISTANVEPPPALTIRAIKQTGWWTQTSQIRAIWGRTHTSIYCLMETPAAAFFDLRFLQRPRFRSVRFGTEGRRNAEECSTDVGEMTTWNGISEDA